MSEDSELTAVLSVLNDEYARGILTATSQEPMSAKKLSEYCDASLPTIYRRIEELQECGLLAERTRPDPDGNHYSVYTARLERFAVDLSDGEWAATVERTDAAEDDPADRLTRMWEEL